MGKTFLLRLLMLIAALDPRAELHTYGLKGIGDLDPVGDAVSYRHRAGEDEEDFEYALADMREVRGELRRRAKVIRALPRDVCPESKVTSDLAVVLVHHVRKAGSEDFLTEVSGTNGIAGAADATLVLKRARGQADGILHVTGRDVDEAEYALSFQPASGAWHLLDGPVTDHTVSDTPPRSCATSAPTPAPGRKTWRASCRTSTSTRSAAPATAWPTPDSSPRTPAAGTTRTPKRGHTAPKRCPHCPAVRLPL
jgi:hypothetical protein